MQESTGGTVTSVYDPLDRLTSRQFSNAGQTARVDETWTSRDQPFAFNHYAGRSGVPCC